MRAFVLLLAAVLAGCVAPTTPPGGPDAATGGWALDCAQGSYEAGPWAQRCMARASHTEGPKQEVWLAANPTDPRNVVLGAKDNNPESSQGCTWNGLSVTHDGGRTWGDVVIGGRFADRQPSDPWFGYSCNTDPMLAFSTNGDLHYVVELYNLAGPNGSGPLGPDPLFGRALLLAGWRLLLATSHDGGDTWPEVVELERADGISAINDYSRIRVSPATGTILTIINKFSGGPFFLAGSAYNVCSVIASRDGGRSEELPVLVADRENPQGLSCMVIAAAPDGTWVLGGSPGFGASGQTYWSWSTNDARTFSDPEPGFAFEPIPAIFEESRYRTGTNLEIAFDLTDGPRSGHLYAIFADARRGDADIYVRRSEDQGRTWLDPVRVNDDNGTNHQFMPNIVVARDGSVHAFFLDKRWDPANKLIDVTHAWSLDGAMTWRNERVSTQSFDGDLGVHQEGFPFIGDYIGIDTAGDEVWGGFPDASNGQTTVVAAARVVRG